MSHPLTKPKIGNVTLTLADTEYSYALSSNCRRFLIRCRSSQAIKFAFEDGDSGTNYLTLLSGEQYSEDNIAGNLMLYFQSSPGGVVVEILEWLDKFTG